MKKLSLSKCPGCGNEIDKETCWCGERIDFVHPTDHIAVPLGCDCFKVKIEDWINFDNFN